MDDEDNEDDDDDYLYNFINIRLIILLTCSTAPVLACRIVAPTVRTIKSNCRRNYCNYKPVTTEAMSQLTLSLFSASCASLRAN